MFIEISENLKKLSKYFPENLYIVGGYVRNKLLDINVGDVDIASSVNVEEVSKRLAGSPYKVKIKSLKCGSILISCGKEVYEYTAFRKDVYADDGNHTPVRVENTDSIEEDAARRDFTINSIYYNINKDVCVDLYHGIVDLSQKVIRCTLEPEKVLKFDGERILRMVRFAGELSFSIEKKTLLAAQKFVSNLQEIGGSRKFMEIEKILYCDQNYNGKIKNVKKSLSILNQLSAWQYFGLDVKKVKYKMVFKTSDRVLGLLIDIVDSQKPECLEAFLEKFLKEQFGFSSANVKKTIIFLSGFYDALGGLNNKEYFFKYFSDWEYISPLVKSKSSHTQNKYNFFYQYIIKHSLTISVNDLKIDENDIQNAFPKIDKRNHRRILNNLLSKVFDGKLQNEKEVLLKEIEKSMTN